VNVIFTQSTGVSSTEDWNDEDPGNPGDRRPSCTTGRSRPRLVGDPPSSLAPRSSFRRRAARRAADGLGTPRADQAGGERPRLAEGRHEPLGYGRLARLRPPTATPSGAPTAPTGHSR
jgi:hypothetical protein